MRQKHLLRPMGLLLAYEDRNIIKSASYNVYQILSEYLNCTKLFFRLWDCLDSESAYVRIFCRLQDFF